MARNCGFISSSLTICALFLSLRSHIFEAKIAPQILETLMSSGMFGIPRWIWVTNIFAHSFAACVQMVEAGNGICSF